MKPRHLTLAAVMLFLTCLKCIGMEEEPLQFLFDESPLNSSSSTNTSTELFAVIEEKRDSKNITKPREHLERYIEFTKSHGMPYLNLGHSQKVPNVIRRELVFMGYEIMSCDTNRALYTIYFQGIYDYLVKNHVTKEVIHTNLEEENIQITRIFLEKKAREIMISIKEDTYIELINQYIMHH